MLELQIDYALDQWRREYGQGGMPRAWQGVSPCQAIADFHGKAPQITGYRPQVVLGTVADDVERAVNSMLSLHPIGFMALRCEYMGRQDRPWEAKAGQLYALGFRMTRDVYEASLQSAKTVLGELLGIARRRAAAARENRALTAA